VKRDAIVVLGSSQQDRTGTYRLSRGCLRAVTHASALAERLDPGVVVLSGWSPNAGPSEAEQMRSIWRGPAVELLLEPTASTTAENAVRTLPMLIERRIEHAVVVSTPLHILRARWFFRHLYGARGIRTSFHAPRLVPTPSALIWELAALTVRSRQLRAGRDELERTLPPE
jgi:uncharacterized SAM-binding protein YcdF (DUF218 family)